MIVKAKRILRVSRVFGVVLMAGVLLSVGLLPASAQSVAAPSGPAAISAAACRELIVNGGFEQNGQSWTQAPNPANRSLISDFYRKSGTRSADMGGQNNTQDRLSQTVTLPSDVNQITLSYWWAYQTEEPDLTTPFDRLTVQLYRTNGTLLATLVSADYTGLTDWAWNPVSSSLSQYAGQTVVLRFTAETDGTRPTRFFVDDVSIKGCVTRKVYLPLIRR